MGYCRFILPWGLTPSIITQATGNDPGRAGLQVEEGDSGIAGGRRLVGRLAEQPLEDARSAQEFVVPDQREGLLAFSAHSFRHTSVSRDMQVGVHPDIVRQKHGHQILDTSLIYTHEGMSEMAAAVARRRLKE